MVLELHRLLCGNLQPDLTLLLLPSLEPSLERARLRNESSAAAKKSSGDENRFEQEQEVFYRRVWGQYLKIAAREPARVVVIEGDHSIEEVHERIVAVVGERLAGLGAGERHP
jgi:dTMP kinase